nr:MFS transporter [Williamsia sterculiae]
MLVAANLRPAVVGVAPLIDEIGGDNGFSNAISGLLTTLPVLFFGLASPIAPRLAARFGIERTIFGALVTLVVAMVLRWIPDTIPLFAGSALIGAAIGICNVVLPALIKRDFAHRSGLMTGLYSMTLSGGAAFAAGVTAPVDAALGGHWRITVNLWILLALVAMVVWIPQLTRMHTTTASPGGHLWRNRVAWAVTIFMGTQSLVFYTLSAWIPSYLMDVGYSRGAAGTTLALAQIVALTASLVAPIIAGRFADQRVVSFVVIGISAVGLIGLVTTHHWVVLWTMLTLIGPGASVSLALLFMVLRSSSTAQTGQVSGMAQFVGYTLAAVGPLAVGAIHDATDSWSIAFSVVGLALVFQAAATTLAARNVRMTP